MNNLNIRVGVPEDIHAVMELALAACEENGFVDPNPKKLLDEIWSALNLDHGLIPYFLAQQTLSDRTGDGNLA